ncbi:MAG TPA: hypothetical protein VHT75_11895 [Acidimicrobiales bacterium]|jgi:hypothetical protein|nr:hypothetical protein [Acidimicrobiales bacterium]
MSGSDTWSPDEVGSDGGQEGAEAVEPWDEALDATDEVTPDAPGDPEGERSLDTQLTVDQTELDEVGARLDEPENLAVLDGGIDDPDGVAPNDADGRGEDGGWELDAEERVTGRHLDAGLDDEG